MKNILKLIMPFPFLVVFLLVLLQPSGATTYRSFLRINKIYILYTDPIVPHTDAHGNFWVGLTPIASLLGAKVTEISDGTATVKFADHSLTFTPGRNSALLDGKVVHLLVAAKRVGRHRHMVIPVQPLLSAFGLRSHWDKHYHVLTFTDANLVDRGVAEEFAGFIEQFEGPPSEPVAPAKAFLGPPYPIAPVVPVALTQNGTKLVWRLRNLSTKNYQMDINLLEMGQAGEEIDKSGIPFPSSFPNPPTYYTIRAHDDLKFNLTVADSITNDPHDSDPANPGVITVIRHQHRVSSVVVWIVLQAYNISQPYPCLSPPAGAFSQLFHALAGTLHGTMRILLIEDEVPIAEVIKQGLEQAGYTVALAHDGRSGLDKAREGRWGLLILDVMLPEMDGWEICRTLRDERDPTPILMLTARDAVSDRVHGLDLGADDYLPKPFDFSELVARVQALLRREHIHKTRTLTVGDLVIDTRLRRVTRSGQEITLTPREYTLLEALAGREGQVLTREVILERVWLDEESLSNTVDVYVGLLRRKIDAGHETKLIQTVHGVGYVLRSPQTPEKSPEKMDTKR